jgi:hypothetical protein
MADVEVNGDLHSNLFDQRRSISSENECLCCIDLNRKLKCALDEISSLHLIIQLLRNELKSDCALASSVLDPSTDKQEDHEMFIYGNLMEVNSKHRNNQYSFEEQDSLPVNEPLLTSNCYAQLINLQDSTVNVNDTIVSNELESLHDTQREDWQIELISVEANCGHHVPTILNGKIYSKTVNKAVNCAIKRNPRLVNEVSIINFPSTGNAQLQSPNKSKSKVVILSNSHLQGCTERRNNYLSDKFRTVGWIKPGALAEEILDKQSVDMVNLKKCDVIVFSADANDVYRNNPNEALMKIIKFIQNNRNTNIMILGIPHRHDLAKYPCVNRAIQVFSYKLIKVANSFNHVTMMECEYNREYFTKHSMHINRRGKGLVSKQLASEIWKLSAAEEIPPISLGWKAVQDQVVSSHALMHETRKAENDYLMDGLKIVPDKLVVVDKHVADYPMDESKKKLDIQVIEDHHVQETNVTSVNLLNCRTIIVNNNADIPIKSKKLRKAPLTRTDDFLW